MINLYLITPCKINKLRQSPILRIDGIIKLPLAMMILKKTLVGDAIPWHVK